MELQGYKIIGTLEYGKVFSKVWLIVWDIFNAIIAILIAIFIVDSLRSSDPQPFMSPEICSFIIILFISFVLRISTGSIYKANKKAIELWQEDAILTCGVIECIEFGGRRRKYQITVKYKKGKVTIISPSENLHKVPFRITRYLTILQNSNIPVLYSPKYNQVLLIETAGESTEIV